MIQFFSDMSLRQKNFLQVLNRVQPSVFSDNFQQWTHIKYIIEI